jgi:hypothetical protein
MDEIGIPPSVGMRYFFAKQDWKMAQSRRPQWAF